MTEAFHGHDNRECGEHRTVGSHRAWCHDCSEWCYPTIPCKGCELPILRTALRDAYVFAAVVNRTAIDVCRPDGGLPALAQEKMTAWEAYR